MKQLLLSLLLVITFSANAQVGVGTTTPLPSAQLDVSSTTRGFLPPRMDSTQRNAIASPANGLIIYNSSTNRLNFFQQNSWQTLPNDSTEWQYDSATKRINFVKALQVRDTVYYDTLRHKFLFSDKATYTNSLGNDIPAVNFGGKYTFKATASKSADSISSNSVTLQVFYEINNASNQYTDGYTGINSITTVNPTATQKPFVYGINNNTLHAGQDTCYQLVGLNNLSYNNGVGETDLLYGIFNQTRMGTASTGNIGNMYGIFNSLSRSVAATGRITGNLYGYFSPFSGSIGSRVDGMAYGVYLSGMTGAALGNYAIFTNQGRNRFGDSVLVSNVGATVPRAFFDINNTSSMIIPTGITAQRPATQVTGMIRYNTDNGGVLETSTGTGWYGTLRKVISIDIPLISPATGFTQSISVTGAAAGSAVSISPTTALSDGLIISWARVSAANTVEVRFNLLYGTAIDPPGQNFYITVSQVQ